MEPLSHLLPERVREILSWYPADNPGTKTNLVRLLMQGRLAGTGRLLILPVDQGWEHGPGRSFGMNPAAYDPRYHFRLAVEAGLSAYAAPLGFLEAAADAPGAIPLILKANNHDILMEEANPLSALTATVDDALRLGCVGIGYTIYPGTAERGSSYEQLREVIAEAKAAGLVVVVWSYPRGGDLSKSDETALDVIAYAAHIAAELGGHIIKVKLPSAALGEAGSLKATRQLYESEGIPREPLSARVAHVVQATFAGRRLVIFSGGAKATDETLYEEARAIVDGGGHGSIMGRNAFQRPQAAALSLLSQLLDIYKG
ncbi:MAG: Fructose-bisphosphate aldolase class 1 [bacterium]|nr:Fructose-bisphosphate aldolase class 1 [bacterium]